MQALARENSSFLRPAQGKDLGNFLTSLQDWSRLRKALKAKPMMSKFANMAIFPDRSIIERKLNWKKPCNTYRNEGLEYMVKLV